MIRSPQDSIGNYFGPHIASSAETRFGRVAPDLRRITVVKLAAQVMRGWDTFGAIVGRSLDVGAVLAQLRALKAPEQLSGLLGSKCWFVLWS